MLTAKEIKDISGFILDKEAVAESNAAETAKDQVADAIETDAFIRGELITIHNILTSYLTEYKLLTGYTKDNYTKVSTYYPYQGINYSPTPIEELQEVYDGALFANNNPNPTFPVGNLFYHTTEDWDSKMSIEPGPNINPDLRNNFPVGDTHYKYDAWWPDTNSKVYKPFYYNNEQSLLTNLLDVFTVYQSGITGAANVSLSEYAPVYRYIDGYAPTSVVDTNNNSVTVNTKSYLFQNSGGSCLYSNNQIAYVTSGSTYSLIKLIEKSPSTNIQAPYYFKYKELASTGTISGNVTISFTLSSGESSVETMALSLVNSWKNLLSTNTENIISAINLNSELTANDTIALNNANALLATINAWLNNPLRFNFLVLPLFITAINNRMSYITTRKDQLSSFLSTTNHFNTRLSLIVIRLNKKNGSLMEVCDIIRTGNTGKQLDESTIAYLDILKRKMVCKRFKQDGSGNLTFTCPIGDDEATYHFNVGDSVYLISDTSTNNFVGRFIGTAKIKAINETTIDEPSTTEEQTSKTKIKIYKINKIVSKKLLVEDKARAVCVLPPYNT